MKFTEVKSEKAFAELLGHEGFSHHLGITITRSPDEVSCLKIGLHKNFKNEQKRKCISFVFISDETLYAMRGL